MHSQVTDGLSNTFMVSEAAGRPDIYRAGGMLDSTVKPSQGSGGGWADYDTGYTTHGYTLDGRKAPGPCHTSCYNGNENYAFHIGGSNHVMGDGSVRYVKNSLNMRVFIRLLTRGRGEVVSSDEY